MMKVMFVFFNWCVLPELARSPGLHKQSISAPRCSCRQQPNVCDANLVTSPKPARPTGSSTESKLQEEEEDGSLNSQTLTVTSGTTSPC